MAGITVAAIVMAFVFRMFRFPGGEMLMYEIVPVLLIAEGIGLFFYIATHGFVKKSQKTPPQEIHHAESTKDIYFNQK